MFAIYRKPYLSHVVFVNQSSKTSKMAKQFFILNEPEKLDCLQSCLKRILNHFLHDIFLIFTFGKKKNENHKYNNSKKKKNYDICWKTCSAGKMKTFLPIYNVHILVWLCLWKKNHMPNRLFVAFLHKVKPQNFFEVSLLYSTLSPWIVVRKSIQKYISKSHFVIS